MYCGMPMVTYGLFAYNTMQFHAVFLFKKLHFFHIKILAKFIKNLAKLVEWGKKKKSKKFPNFFVEK
jgi:hypothetical protein